MTAKQIFISVYLDDYVRMAYRQLTKKVDIDSELILVNNMFNLMDKYAEGELIDYVHYNKIV